MSIRKNAERGFFQGESVPGQTDSSQSYLNDVYKGVWTSISCLTQDKLMYIYFYFCSLWKHIQTMFYTENFAAGVFAYLVKLNLICKTAHMPLNNVVC